MLVQDFTKSLLPSTALDTVRELRRGRLFDHVLWLTIGRKDNETREVLLQSAALDSMEHIRRPP